MPAPLPATEITALLGRGTHFEGKLQFEGRVRIDGSFRGEIRSSDTLVIGDGAEVDAEIDVATVIIKGGNVQGNVRARPQGMANTKIGTGEVEVEVPRAEILSVAEMR